MPGHAVYSVATLVSELRTLLETSYRNVWVEGEVSDLAIPASGHLYFSLKEDGALVRCAFFRNRRPGSETPEEGMQVLVRGQVSVYPKRGDLQLIVHFLEPAGEGALRRAFQALKRKLEQEGLFDPGIKKPLPAYPRTIGVITSRSGAALHDILVTLRRRYPPAKVIVHPVPVQGEQAPGEIAAMLDRVADNMEMDVLILARGGGSLEDLQAFNDETVARAIHRCPLPLVSGIGHETDVTIADLVADSRAATPTAAAEMVTPLASEIHQQLSRHRTVLVARMTRRLGDLGQHADHAASRLVHPAERLRRHRLELESLHRRALSHVLLSLSGWRQTVMARRDSASLHNPANWLRLLRERHHALNHRVVRAGFQRLYDRGRHLDRQRNALRLLGPGQTLSRGYAILRDREKRVVGSVSSVHPGDSLSALLADGSIPLTVDGD